MSDCPYCGSHQLQNHLAWCDGTSDSAEPKRRLTVSKFDKAAARAWVAGPAMGTHKACKYLLAACDYIDKLERVREAAASVLSEEGVREYLSAYVMGCELVEALAACDDGKGKTPTPMTTPPTPEQTLAEYIHWRDSNGSIGFPDANRLAQAAEALLAERDRLKMQADQANLAAEILLKKVNATKTRITALEADLAHADQVIKDLARERDTLKW